MRPLLLDQGLPLSAAVILREHGWNAQHVREIGMRDLSDEAILERTARELFVLITLDPDFPQALAFTSALRPSVVLIRQQRLRATDVAALIASICEEYDAALSEGSVLLSGCPNGLARAERRAHPPICYT
jgi:predicted nuclease of predicted toxin-antitoxin system